MHNDYIRKYSTKYNNKNSYINNIFKYLKSFIVRSFLVIIIFLLLAISFKTNSNFKNIIYKNIYENSFSFTSFKKFCDSYLGGISFIDKYINKVSPVFNSKLVYNNSSKFYDGVSLDVGKNYLVPVIETGIVVYIGNKDKYGNCIIIQGMDGVDISYSDIENSSVKLYDYIEKGELLGEVKDNQLILVYSKNGKVLNYEDYLK